MDECFEHGYALLIGVNDNRLDRLALRTVGKDIEAVQRVLTHPERCGYPPANVKTLTGQEACRAQILGGLKWLQERIQSDRSGNATAVVYYSGHGWRDTSADPPDFFLIPYDMLEDGFRSSALRAEDFGERLLALQPQRLLVVLDCCHAGGMDAKGQGLPVVPSGFSETAIAPDLLMGQGSIPSAKGQDLHRLAEGAGRAVLSSSTGEQQSYLRRDRTMSIFTYHLIEALSGHAQPQEGAAEVLVSDVMSYVSRHVPQTAQEECGARQEPDYRVSGNFPVALLLGGKGLRKGQSAPDPLTLFGEAGARTPSITTRDTTIATIVHGDVYGTNQTGIVNLEIEGSGPTGSRGRKRRAPPSPDEPEGKGGDQDGQ